MRPIGWIAVVSLLAWQGAGLPRAQEPESVQIQEAVRQARSMDKLRHPFKDRVAWIAARGRAGLPHLRRLLREGRADRLVVTAAGLVARPDDRDVVGMLLEMTFEREGAHRRSALEALLRIGGAALDRLHRRLERGGGDVELVRAWVDRIWRIESLETLDRARQTMETMARDHPSSSVAMLAAEYGVARVDAALQVGIAPRAAQTRALLSDLLHQRHPAFAGLAGGVVRGWAAEQLVEHHRSGAATELRGLLDGYRQQAIELAPGLHKRLLLALERAGGPLAADERDWLDARASFDPHPLPLVCSSEQLRAWRARARARAQRSAPLLER